MTNSHSTDTGSVAKEIADANDQMLLAIRQLAQSDPAQASYLFGMSAETLSSIAEMSRTDIRKIAGSRMALFGLRVQGAVLQNLAKEHPERIPMLVALQATDGVAS